MQRPGRISPGPVLSFLHVGRNVPASFSAACTGTAIRQVPVFLRHLLQAGYAALVDLHREGREEFLIGHEDSPTFLCWTYGNKG